VADTQHRADRFFYRFRPDAVGPHAKLRIRVDLPARMTNPAATAVVYPRHGPKKIHPLALGNNGVGLVTVNFGTSDVRQVDLVLSNASLRFDCPPKDFPDTVYSCGGSPKDDFRPTASAPAWASRRLFDLP
jgi:hypothetical protein